MANANSFAQAGELIPLSLFDCRWIPRCMLIPRSLFHPPYWLETYGQSRVKQHLWLRKSWKGNRSGNHGYTSALVYASALVLGIKCLLHGWRTRGTKCSLWSQNGSLYSEALLSLRPCKACCQLPWFVIFSWYLSHGTTITKGGVEKKFHKFYQYPGVPKDHRRASQPVLKLLIVPFLRYFR